MKTTRLAPSAASSQLSLLALLGTLALAATGCGNGSAARGVDSSVYSSNGSWTSNITTQEGNFTCPSTPNVLSTNGNTGVDDPGNYRVCPSSASQAEILVHGRTQSSSIVCVIPAQVVDESHIYVKPDVSPTGGGLPWAQCFDTTTSKVLPNFPNINWNAAYIVEYPNLIQMRTCLTTGNFYSCPTYSYGKFR